MKMSLMWHILIVGLAPAMASREEEFKSKPFKINADEKEKSIARQIHNFK
jgi:hypothetical protein